MSSPEEADLHGQATNPTSAIPAETPPFPCPQCQRRFQTKAAQLRHSNGHHPAHDRCPIQCRLCPFLTTRYKAFLQHRRDCHPKSVMQYCCPLCNKAFKVLGQYYEHCSVHLALNEYGGDQDVVGVENCTIGSLDGSLDVLRDAGPLEPVALPDLTVGLNLEVEAVPSSGSVLPTIGNSSILKSLIVQKSQSNNISMASVESPRPLGSRQQPGYQCPYCPEKSNVPNWLQVHVYMCHGAVVPTAFTAKCGHCDLVADDPVKLSVHFRDHHADISMTYRCPTCGKSYRKLFFYEAHLKSHAIPQILEKHGMPKGIEPPLTKEASQTFTCPDCCETCADLTTYENHLQTRHAEITIEPNHNAESLTLSTNSVSDSELNTLRDSLYGPTVNPKTFKCPLCPQTFDDATQLLSHQEACLLNRGQLVVEPAPEPETLSVDDVVVVADDEVILVKEEIDTYLTGASWYKEVVIPQSKVYSCSECDQQFDSLVLVERHTIAVHCPANLALLYKCTKCEETFEGFCKFQKHSLKHV